MPRISTFLLLLLSLSVTAQRKLTDSPAGSRYTFIYQLTDKEIAAVVYGSHAAINDNFLHTKIDSFPATEQYIKQLAYGNYLFVTAKEHQITYRIREFKNVYIQYVNNLKNVQFALFDEKGNAVRNARVTIGKSRNVPFNTAAQLYIAGKQREEDVIKVVYNDVVSYFGYEEADSRDEGLPFFEWIIYRSPVKYTWIPFRNLFRSGRFGMDPSAVYRRKYTGFLVTSKPKYKPLDTVKLKAYVVKANGSGINGVAASLYIRAYNYNEKLISKVLPYKDGAYLLEFKLADSLKLTLDKNYELVLRNAAGEEMASNSFEYEDYELKSTSYTVRADKQIHYPNNPIALFLKGTDENDLPVADGRVEVTVKTDKVLNYHGRNAFVKDTLWIKKLPLDVIGETKLVLPDSIFPSADLDFTVYLQFLNSNNESMALSKSLTFKFADAYINTTFTNDSLLVEYFEKGKSVVRPATITGMFAAGTNKTDVTLPYKFRHDHKVTDYRVVSNDVKSEITIEDFEDLLNVVAVQSRDTLKVLAINPRKIPFWYTVFSNDKVLFQGFGTELDTAVSHTGKKAAHIRLDYFWGDDEEGKSKEISAVFDGSQLNMVLTAPVTVYPGEEVTMKLHVTDVQLNPVKDLDVTAQAFTAKFKDVTLPRLPYFGPNTSARKTKEAIEESSLDFTSGTILLNWQKLGKALGLDTMAYYRFVNTKELYTIVEESKDNLTQVVPFVVNDGKIVPVQIVYIDGVPVFFDQADQFNTYAFAVKPGKHNIALRTIDQSVLIEDFEVTEGKRTVFSVHGIVGNPKAVIKPMGSKLDAYEADILSKYMFKVKDNFSSRKATVTAGEQTWLLNSIPLNGNSYDRLIGPVRYNNLVFHSGQINQPFIKEPGYTYAFSPGLIKQKSYEGYGFNVKLSDNKNSIAKNHRQQALTTPIIDSLWKEYLDLRSATTSLISRRSNRPDKNLGYLEMEVDTNLKISYPYVKNVVIFKPDAPEFVEIFPGKTTDFGFYAAGTYRMLYLLKDNRYFIIEDVQVKANGKNYFKWADVAIRAADSVSNQIDQFIKSGDPYASDYLQAGLAVNVAEVFNDRYYDKTDFKTWVSGVVLESDLPVPGVSVKVKGTTFGTTTNAEGRFYLNIPVNGVLVFSYVGFEITEITVNDPADVEKIILKPSSSNLEGVVVGYDSMLAGRVAGLQMKSYALSAVTEISIRGAAGYGVRAKPLYIVDGVVYEGNVDKLNPAEIVETTIVKPDEAAAMYGSRAANGVIVITTKKAIAAIASGDGISQQQTMRTNFSDVGFWQPKLITDQNGEVHFKVKFPDDITKWKTQIIAMNGKKQVGYTETNIKSFKSISANFVAPQFALAGDSINVIGKLMNYTAGEEAVIRSFKYNDNILRSGAVKFKNAHIDTLSIVANAADSLKFEYTLQQENGYFDGELRKIPVFKQGVLETKGVFAKLNGDTTVTYTFDKQLGKVMVRAESSVFPALLEEIDKIRNYQYLCNEQLASKLKALLLEKQVRGYLKQTFVHEKDIKNILKLLSQNRRQEGTWGWWKNTEEEWWISLHVVEALLDAEKSGYTIDLDKKTLYTYLIQKQIGNDRFDKLYYLRLLKLLDEKIYITDWVLEVEKVNKNKRISLYDRLLLMDLKQQSGIKISMDSLLLLKKKTMFGNSYWEEDGNKFWDNSVQNTLLAYKILRRAGNYAAELENVQGYFMEQRKSGQWRNTYESVNILETILPEMMGKEWNTSPASITLNNQDKIIQFPYETTTTDVATITLTKSGKMPVYVTAYQQFQNEVPQKVSKDFTVSSSFVEDGVTVTRLTGGKKATLKVTVDVSADADYVMIEVPIPAGCSYENKVQQFWGVETHREYFKEKTAIFCTKLKQGKYTFDIELMPRYSGNFTLNPAKAELMYFPVFYGREGIKTVHIE